MWRFRKDVGAEGFEVFGQLMGQLSRWRQDQCSRRAFTFFNAFISLVLDSVAMLEEVLYDGYTKR